jgi:Flp pilus assembly protein TadG
MIKTKSNKNISEYQRVKGFLRGLISNEDGGVVTTLMVSAVALIAFVGLSVDTTRGYMLKQRLAYAVDVAALAAAKGATTEDVTVIGQRYFNANFPTGFMGATNVNVTFTPSPDDTQVTVTASAELPTAFITVAGIDKVDVGMQTIAQRKMSGLELVLALDNTGSMNGYIDDLQDASNELLDVLYGNNDTVENLYVSILPFDTRPNLANYPSVVGFTPSNPSKVCANPRPAPHTMDDAPPNISLFSSEWTNWSKGCQAVSALALTQSKATLQNKINEMVKAGYTRIDVAAAWAFRMLSPEWRGLWGNPNLPMDYDEPLMDKATIIMTDGENVPRDGTSVATANAQFTEACNNMTAAGIVVYTIQFRTNSAPLETLLTDCATSPAHYYHAADGQLSAVFTEIASKLTILRLIK